MGKIAIISGERAGTHPDKQRLTEMAMPADYMADFSLLSVLVDRLPEAIRLLENHRFDVITEDRCTKIVTRNLQHTRDLFRVLENGGIDYRFTDIADSIYQG